MSGLMKNILGVDIGGTNVDVVLLRDNFEFVISKPTTEVFSNFRSFLKSLISSTNACKVGIGIAAWLKRKNSEVVPVFAPNLPDNLNQIVNPNLDVEICVDNDANCFAMFAAKKLKARNLVGITVGTGVGGGIIIDGKLYRGGGMAGEVGHFSVSDNGRPCGCGFKGHLESYFGARAFGFEGKIIKDLIENGTIYLTDGFKYFCREIANIIRFLDPEIIALGGRVGMNLDLDIVKKSIFEYLPKFYETEIVSINDELSVAKGACYLFD